MADPNKVLLGVTCACGEQYKIGIAGLDLETMQFSCPGCGMSDGFSAEQIAQIVTNHKLVAVKARYAIRKAVKDRV